MEIKREELKKTQASSTQDKGMDGCSAGGSGLSLFQGWEMRGRQGSLPREHTGRMLRRGRFFGVHEGSDTNCDLSRGWKA